MNSRDLYNQRMMNAFGDPQLVIDHGQGVYVFDQDGKRYLDLAAGSGANALGYSHPAVVAAINEQARKVIHVSNLSPPRRRSISPAPSNPCFPPKVTSVPLHGYFSATQARRPTRPR